MQKSEGEAGRVCSRNSKMVRFAGNHTRVTQEKAEGHRKSDGRGFAIQSVDLRLALLASNSKNIRNADSQALSQTYGIRLYIKVKSSNDL